MKTMLGGWEDVQRLLASERAARPGSAEPSPSVRLQRCVALAPKEGASQACSARRFSLRETRVGGVNVPLPPLPAAERFAPRRAATRPQALTRPVQRPAAGGGADSAARLAQLALDETCELRDVDFLLLLQPRVPPQPAPAPYIAAGLRRGGTLIEPALRVVPPPTRRRALCAPSALQALLQKAKALLGWRH
ncbi:MAG: hypothetical protein ABI895_19965 [Deltaproteobacteria bacterium]